MPDPTYKDRGLMLTEEEYTWVSASMTHLIEKIEREHPQDIEKIGPLKRLLIRLSHVVRGGEGMTDAIAERYARQIDRAIRSQNPDAVSRATAAMLAAAIRLDPDPAEFLGKLLVQQVAEGVQVQSQVLMTQWLCRLQEILQAAKTDFDAGKYPSAAETLQWVIDTVDAGVEDLRTGHEPWLDSAAEEDASAQTPATE